MFCEGGKCVLCPRQRKQTTQSRTLGREKKLVAEERRLGEE